MNINRKISKYNFNKGSVSRIKYIVIHYVGALGGVEDNCRYYGGGNRNVKWGDKVIGNLSAELAGDLARKYPKARYTAEILEISGGGYRRSGAI